MGWKAKNKKSALSDRDSSVIIRINKYLIDLGFLGFYFFFFFFFFSGIYALVVFSCSR